MLHKNISKSKEASVPSAVYVDYIRLTSGEGKTVDIKNICVKMELTESLYTPYITLRLEFTDATNLIESFPIIGQEKISVSMSRKPPGGNMETMKLNFKVLKYPLYAKPKSESLQVFSIEAISNHAYDSTFKRISRSYSGTAEEQIQKIFKEDLNYSSANGGSFKVKGSDVSRHRGIINIQTPLQAAEYFRKIAFDGNNTPFYLYQTLEKGDLCFTSTTDLYSQTPHGTYYDVRQFSGDGGGAKDYDERKTRIVDISSDLRLNKYDQAQMGAWASANYFLDWSDKSSMLEEYSYNDGNKLASKSPLIDNSVTKDYNQHQEHISVNDASFKDEDNYGFMRKRNIAKSNSFKATLETMSHDLRLFGDFKLNAGTIIDLKINLGQKTKLYIGTMWSILLMGIALKS